MASSGSRLYKILRYFDLNRPIFNASKIKQCLFYGISSGCIGLYAYQNLRRPMSLEIRQQIDNLTPVVIARCDTVRAAPLTHRERRFQGFASLEYSANFYMTPNDFFESILFEEPRVRVGRVVLSNEDLKQWLDHTPDVKHGSEQLFQSMSTKGIISYTEYLFLLCVLTKARSGFRIAFNMFDTDGNSEVDKQEFLIMERTLSKLREEKAGTQEFAEEEDSMVTQETHQDTTLLVHLFGLKGEGVLQYKDFCTFMTNLQTEILAVEFNEYAHGQPMISEEDFAKILLRYTSLSPEEMDEYLDRLRERIPEIKGITFDDFHDFCQFLNHLEDFNVAIGMYTIANMPVSQDEFKRAVKVCTGQDLDADLVNTVFQIFDTDGDGSLSSREFISIMKNRLHRQAKIQDRAQTTWESFKTCLKDEMKYS